MKRNLAFRAVTLLLALTLCLALAACGSSGKTEAPATAAPTQAAPEQTPEPTPQPEAAPDPADPRTWYTIEIPDNWDVNEYVKGEEFEIIRKTDEGESQMSGPNMRLSVCTTSSRFAHAQFEDMWESHVSTPTQGKENVSEVMEFDADGYTFHYVCFDGAREQTPRECSGAMFTSGTQQGEMYYAHYISFKIYCENQEQVDEAIEILKTMKINFPTEFIEQ